MVNIYSNNIYLINGRYIIKGQVKPAQVWWIFQKMFKRGTETLEIRDGIVAEPKWICFILYFDISCFIIFLRTRKR